MTDINMVRNFGLPPDFAELFNVYASKEAAPNPD